MALANSNAEYEKQLEELSKKREAQLQQMYRNTVYVVTISGINGRRRLPPSTKKGLKNLRRNEMS
jgi:hypothetical protein